MEEDAVSPIVWTEVIETGVRELDAEHGILIDQCNKLIALIQGGSPWAAVVTAARELAQSCHAHFLNEESILHESGFPRLDRHKGQHHEIERRLNDLVGFLSGVDGSRAEHRTAALTARTTLIDILFRHDLDYKSHLQQLAGR